MLIDKYENTAISLSARFESEIISLEDVAAFFTFLNETFAVSLKHSSPTASVDGGLPKVITNVSVDTGSIKTCIEVLKSRDFQVGVAASLTASVIWAAATYPWAENVTVESNVPETHTIYRIPVDPQLTAMAEAMNKSGKPWSLEISAKDPRYSQELSVTLKGNQPQPEPTHTNKLRH